jgi:formate--tetrahydrofolate ligase
MEAGPSRFAPLYAPELPLESKLRRIAAEIYRAADVQVPVSVAAKLRRFEEMGFGHVPVCVAKTQYSFSADPGLMGAPSGHVLPVRDVRLSAGAGFVVAICGEIMTMPGLPRRPAAESIGLDADGAIDGLF